MDFESFVEHMQGGASGGNSFKQMAQSMDAKYNLAQLNPIKSAATIAALLTDPKLHANTYRLEALVHILLGCGQGTKQLNRKDLNRFLNDFLGQAMGYLEDPLEDVFVSNVSNEMGNFRIFEGIWETSDYYLQVVLDVVSSLPPRKEAQKLHKAIISLLKLSDEIAQRRKLNRFTEGGGEDKGVVPIPSNNRLKALRKIVTFKASDLQKLEINTEDLAQFVISEKAFDELTANDLGKTVLERQPLVKDGDIYFVMLPTAISIAIRFHIFDWMRLYGLESSFVKNLAYRYSDFLRDTQILGSLIPDNIPLIPRKVTGGYLIDIIHTFDEGRYVHLVADIDDLTKVDETGFIGFAPNEDEKSKEISAAIKGAYEHCSKKEGFKEGFTFVIGCGYGRPSAGKFRKEHENWGLEVISAPDLQTLGWAIDAKGNYLWKLLEAKNWLHQNQITIMNMSGLLNLYGYWESTDFMLVPKDGHFDGNPVMMHIPTNSHLAVRARFRNEWDRHAVLTPENEHAIVWRKSPNEYFENEYHKTQYVCPSDLKEGTLRGVVKGKYANWWLEPHSYKHLSRGSYYQFWDAGFNWLARCVSVFERRLKVKYPENIHIIMDLSKWTDPNNPKRPTSEDQKGVEVCVAQDLNQIVLNFQPEYFLLFRLPQNIAEKYLVDCFIEGAIELLGLSFSKQEKERLLAEIIPNNDARFFHMFEVRNFRDWFQNKMARPTILVDASENAMAKLGSAWLAQNNKEPAHYSTKQHCTKFLNKVVDGLWKRIQERLNKYDKGDILRKALKYQFGVNCEKDTWLRTVRAVQALNENRPETGNVVIEKIGKLSASDMALRNLCEIALCECPQEGEKIGFNDFSPLLADILAMMELGGWSDAINKNVMRPEIEVSPSGEVLADLTFRSQYMNKMVSSFEKRRLDAEARRYGELCQPLETSENKIDEVLDDEFISAFEKEFGVPPSALVSFREIVEDLAIKREEPVFEIKWDELLSEVQGHGLLSSDKAEIILNSFSLGPRESWGKPPKGFDWSDIVPWKFRRRLSVLWRPIIKVGCEEKPSVLISPSLINDAFIYLISGCHSAEFNKDKFRSNEMKVWWGKETHRQGLEFNNLVAERLEKLGFQVKVEVLPTELLQTKFEINYGDVDVLAWDAARNELLIVECKDLMLAKTHGEIAEQLANYQGLEGEDGSRDNLRKHLDRVEVINSNLEKACKSIGLNAEKVRVRSLVVFSKTVPMQFLNDEIGGVEFHQIDELER